MLTNGTSVAPHDGQAGASAGGASSVQAQASRLDVMNFLNEIAGKYPAAISFASGRPAEDFFDFETMLARVPVFVRRFAQERGIDVGAAYRVLGQYGRTNGIINDLIARQIDVDEGIVCAPERIVVTGGCQEALDLLVTTLCQQPDDIILVRSPCYIGITGVADLNRIEMAPFTCQDPAAAADALVQAVMQAEQRGKRPRVLYLVPEFDNPTGTVLPRAVREEIIALCAARGIVILEDNPYGMFRFEGERVPTMFSLDRHGCVVYLGTYSKTICPALRVGFAAVPECLGGDAAASAALVDKLSQAKSFVSVNTSQLTQAAVGALLLDEQCSLARRVAPAIEVYRRNRDAMVACLERHFSGMAGQVRWNVPEGGFFLTVSLPFAFGLREAEQCAGEYGVLTMPLSFFALNDEQDCRVRLAFSNVSPERIETGIARFAQFVNDTLQQGHANA